MMDKRSGNCSKGSVRDRERRLTAEAADIAALMDLTDSPLSFEEDIQDIQQSIGFGSNLHPQPDKIYHDQPNRRQTVDPKDLISLLDDLRNEESERVFYHQRDDISESIHFDFNLNIRPDSRRQTIDPEDMKMLLEDLQDDEAEAEANDSDFPHVFQNEDHIVRNERSDHNSSTRSSSYLLNRSLSPPVGALRPAVRKPRQTVDASDMAKLLEDLEDSEKVDEEDRTLSPSTSILLQEGKDVVEASSGNLLPSMAANPVLMTVVENQSKGNEVDTAASSSGGPFTSPSTPQPSSTSKSRKRKSRLGLGLASTVPPASTDSGLRKSRRDTFEGGTAVLDLLLEECSDGSHRALPLSDHPTGRRSSGVRSGSSQSSPTNRRVTADPADIAAILRDIECEQKGVGGEGASVMVEDSSHSVSNYDVLHFLPSPKTTAGSSHSKVNRSQERTEDSRSTYMDVKQSVSVSMSIDSNISDISCGGEDSPLDVNYHHHHQGHGNRRETVNSMDLANLMHDLEEEEVGLGLQLAGGGGGGVDGLSSSHVRGMPEGGDSGDASINTVDLVSSVRETLEEVGVGGRVGEGGEDHSLFGPENQSINTVMLMSEVEAYLSAEGCPVAADSMDRDMDRETLSTTDLCLDDLLPPHNSSSEQEDMDGQSASIAILKKTATISGTAICPSPLPTITAAALPVRSSVLRSCLSSHRKGKSMSLSLNVSSDFYDQQQQQRSVIFGSPEAATYHIQSPTTSYTPIPRRQAKDMFPMHPPLVFGEEEPEDRITAENSSILEEWERLTSDSGNDPPFDPQEYFPETGTSATAANRSPNVSASKKKRRRSMRRRSSRDFMSDDVRGSLEAAAGEEGGGGPGREAEHSPGRKRRVSRRRHPVACELAACETADTRDTSESCDVSDTIQLHHTLADLVSETVDEAVLTRSTARSMGGTPACDVGPDPDPTQELELDLNTLLHRIDTHTHHDNDNDSSSRSGGQFGRSPGEDDVSGEDSLGRHMDARWRRAGGGIPFSSSSGVVADLSVCGDDDEDDRSGSGNGLTLNMILGEVVGNTAPDSVLVCGGEGGGGSGGPWCSPPSGLHRAGETSLEVEVEAAKGRASVDADTWKRTAPPFDVSDSFDLSMVAGGDGDGGETVQLEGRLCDLVTEEDYLMELSGSSEGPLSPLHVPSVSQDMSVSMASATLELEGDLGELLALASETLPPPPTKEIYGISSDSINIAIAIDGHVHGEEGSKEEIVSGKYFPQRNSLLINSNYNNNSNVVENSFGSYQEGSEAGQSFPSSSPTSTSSLHPEGEVERDRQLGLGLGYMETVMEDAEEEEDSECVLSRDAEAAAVEEEMSNYQQQNTPAILRKLRHLGSEADSAADYYCYHQSQTRVEIPSERGDEGEGGDCQQWSGSVLLPPQPLEGEKDSTGSRSRISESSVEGEGEGEVDSSDSLPPKNLDEEIMQALATLWPGLAARGRGEAGGNATAAAATSYEQLTRTHLHRSMQTVLVSTSADTKHHLLGAIDRAIAAAPPSCSLSTNPPHPSRRDDRPPFIDAGDSKVLQDSLSFVNEKLATLRRRRVELQQQRIRLEKTCAVTREKQVERNDEKTKRSRLSGLRSGVEAARAAKLAKESQLWRVSDEVNELLEKRKESLLKESSSRDVEKEKEATRVRFQELVASANSTYQEAKQSLQLLNRLTWCRLRTYTSRLIEVEALVSGTTKATLRFHLAPSATTHCPATAALVVTEASCSESTSEEGGAAMPWGWGGVADRETLLARSFLRDVLCSEGAGGGGGGLLSASQLGHVRLPAEIPGLLTKADGCIGSYRCLRGGLRDVSQHAWTHAGWQWDVSFKADRDTAASSPLSVASASADSKHRSLADVVTLFRVDGLREVQLPVTSLLNSICHRAAPLRGNALSDVMRNLDPKLGTGGKVLPTDDNEESLSAVVTLCESMDQLK